MRITDVVYALPSFDSSDRRAGILLHQLVLYRAGHRLSNGTSPGASALEACPSLSPPAQKGPGRWALPFAHLAHRLTGPTPQVLAPKQNKLVFAAHRSSGTCSQ